jgi:hypothetical protein
MGVSEGGAMTPQWMVSLLVVGMVGLSGCAADDAEPDADTASSSTRTSSSTDPADAVARRIEEAERLAVRDHGADPAELVVVRAEEVQWPDSGFGCPLTGRTYEPGPFPGYLVELGDGELEYTYMAGQDTELKECLFLE